MITINIRNNFPQVVAQLNRLSQNVGDKAMVRALNKTVDQGKTEMARKISQEFRISSSVAKDRLAVRRASVRGGALRFEAVLEATRRGKGRSMNLIHFVEQKVTLAEAKRRTKAGDLAQLRFQIKRTGGKKMLPGAFIANNGRTVFVRTGKQRLPIKAVNTIGVVQMFNTQRINNVVREVMLKRFDANFKRELRSVLKGYVK
jgi:hypothetical protein